MKPTTWIVIGAGVLVWSIFLLSNSEQETIIMGNSSPSLAVEKVTNDLAYVQIKKSVLDDPAQPAFFTGGVRLYFKQALAQAKAGDHKTGEKLARILHQCELGNEDVALDYKANEDRGWDDDWLAERVKRLDAHAAQCEGLSASNLNEGPALIAAAKQAGLASAVVFYAQLEIEKTSKALAMSTITPQEFDEVVKTEAQVIQSLERLALQGYVPAINQLAEIQLRSGAAPTDFLTGKAYELISMQDWSIPLSINDNTDAIRGIEEGDISRLIDITTRIYDQCCKGRSKNN